MSKSKFDKAHCEELGFPISPYFARELYFNQSSKYYKEKLNYTCKENGCSAELYARCIYKEKRNRQVPHFAKKPTSNHSAGCPHSDFEIKVNTQDPESTNVIGTKVGRFPSVLLLEGFGKQIAGIPVVEDEIEVEDKVTKKRKSDSKTKDRKKSVSRTSLLDNIVDCFEKGDKDLLETEELTIGSKTRRYNKFFKKVQFYFDENDLIYWGTIKELKKFGKNYRIVFNERPWINGKSLQASIYLEDEVIQASPKEKSFRNQLDSLINSKVEIKCYVVGANPAVKEINKGENTFEVVSIQVENLNHISFTFDEVNEEPE